jgi:transposase
MTFERTHAGSSRPTIFKQEIRIVVEGLRGEISISDRCRREKNSPSQYYKWSKQFLEAGKNALTIETSRNATDDEAIELREENERLKIALAEAHIDVIQYF